ncbi:MAG: sortase [Clostridia bacterium]|nr:sortase [Clostridia bacterium]
MNQILVSEKLYVTPEIKRKRKFFKIEFILSIFALVVLSSYYIYAEYDRNKNEAVSQEILNSIEFETIQPTTTTVLNMDSEIVEMEEDYIRVTLNSALNSNEQISIITKVDSAEVPSEQRSVASDGTEYSTIGVIKIPKIGVNYPILSTTTVELLKISPCKFWGCNPNEVGNFCIVGHNYRNSLFFSKVPTLEVGDVIQIIDLSGTIVEYSIYDKYIVDPDNVACTSQLTDGRREITIITCTNDSKQRVVIKATEKK